MSLYWLIVVVLNFAVLIVICTDCCTECHYAKCRYDICRCNNCCCTKCRCTNCCWTKCHCTDCCCTECRCTICHFRLLRMQSVVVTSIVSRQKKREKRKREREIHKQFCLSGSCPSFLTLSQMHSLKVHQKHSLSLSLSFSFYNTDHWLTQRLGECGGESNLA